MSATATATERQVVDLVPTAEIVAGNNDRTEFEPTALAELASSMAEHGLAQPITVRPIAPRLVDGRTVSYEIVAGERRYRAACLNGWETIPALVRPMDDRQAQRIMTLENLHRVDLNPMDEAGAYQKWVTLGASVEEIARETNKKPAHIRKMLSLLELCADVQHLVKTGQLPAAYAFAMAELNEWSQSQAVKALGNCSRMPTLADWRKVCGELLASQQQTAMFDLDALTATLTGEKKRRSIGRPVSAELPAPDMRKSKGYIGTCIVDYADQLRAAGREAEALALYTVTQHLVDIGRLLLDGDAA